MRPLISAFAYFSILPVGSSASRSAPARDALAFLPLVGAVIGAIAAGALLLGERVVPASLLPLLPIAIVWVLSGAIHLDGFLDCCDALFASATGQRRLDIMKDPRHGSFALVGMALLALFWWEAASLLVAGGGSVWWVLPLSCATARLCALANAWIFPYARPDVDAHPLRIPPNRFAFAANALAIAVCVAWARDVPGIGIIVVAQLVAFGLGRFAARRLGGGLVGDVYGWIISLLEPALLCAFVLTGGASRP